MEIVTDSAQGVDLMTGLPMIQSEEDLKNYLGGDKDEPQPKPDEDKSKEPQKKNDPTAIGDPINQDTPDDTNLPGEKDDKEEPVEYPTILHYLNEKHSLNLNLEEVQELNKEQEAEALDSIIEKMTQGVNSALEEYQYIETLLQDTEIQEVLRAKQEGKSLRDLYAQFSTSPQGMADDELAMQDFKKRFPRSPDEAIQGMLESLKKNGQFEPFVKGLREQHVEEQSLHQQRASEEARAKAEQDAAREAEQMEKYAQYLSGVNTVYGVPLTQEMKEAIFGMTTARDKNGFTQLDHALQSDEGTVLAALGIAYMKQIIQNGASIQKNRARGRVMDKIFDDPKELQSSGGRTNQEDPYNADVLNRF